MSKITIRCSKELKDEFKEQCDSDGTNMSEELKKHMREVTNYTPGGRLPDDAALAEGYRTVYWMAGGNPVEIDDAESKIADALNIRKAAVRHRITEPLRKRGYLTLKQGVHEVRYRPNVDLADDVLDSDPTAEEEAAA